MLPKFLTADYPMEKHYFLVPKFALRLMGFYPESKSTLAVRLWAFFNFFILTYGCYAEAYYGIYYIPINIVVALDALCPVASSILSLLKMVCIWWYQDEIRALIQHVRYLTEAQQSPRKLEYKKKFYTLATVLTALMLSFGFLTSNSYSVRSLLGNLLRHLRGEAFVYDTPFKMMFPDVLLSMPIYPITYLLVHWHGYITVLCFVSADGLFLGFCLYISVLIKSLEEDVQELLAVQSIKNSQSDLTEQRVCVGLQRLIDRHNEIADLMERLSGIMVEITLGHFVTSSLIIGTSVIDFMLFSGYGVIVYIVYTCAVGTEIFLYCLGGTYVMETCNDLAKTAFHSQWYAHSVPVQKMLLLLIVRAQRVLIVKVPFFSPSLETLTSILRFTGSLIALAKSII